ncbi:MULTISPECIES: sugar MFS transporter [unclassified Colwellia]|uniref:MFS transporter n=1 Tax=unclassified Colwellia TaxID=196834 RepID=UPI0015F78171|nr:MULTISPECIES: MFS transporter [unclassified Colwellia]MBA6223512.1 MFS transporter [Colwellia sp. MB3u-45]MBA6269131.1 MFS transporter [Colwellia sp. MB3u-43]MBA6289671.1 MFS transporter [Colwellia sp. MB3u-4]MBA6320783.1 MFS transporter [Colwellia sp. MB02u-19]MBA6323995.1 MFS transporter [Colwellia sp. MB02u-18]
MSRLVTISAIAAAYFVFAILLNSVGTVILQSINSFGVSMPQASTLEGFKDLSIAFVSFFIASLIPRIGYKVTLMMGLSLVTLACLITPILGSFWVIKLLFACIGVSFALVKVSVYSIIGQLSSSVKSHSSLLNTIEGIFMLGSLSGYWLFSFYVDPNIKTSTDWLDVYYPLAAMIALTLVLVAFSSIEKAEISSENKNMISGFMHMIKMSFQPLVLVFVLSIFLYVLIEQGIGTWLPTFNSEVLGLPSNVSVQMTSIFAAALAIGRLLAGQVLRVIHWYVLLNICLIVMGLTIIVLLPLTELSSTQNVTSIFDAPLVAYLLPLIGLMMAPIYPVLNSVMLSSIERSQHAAMTGLIVIFSALGGTTGSIITGFSFQAFGGQTAFYLSLIPMGLIFISLYFFKTATQKTLDLKPV